MDQRDTLTLAVVNFHAEWGDTAANLTRITELAREAAGQGAEFVLFPETALTGYDHSTERMHERVAETVPGPASDALAAVAREEGIWLACGLAERDPASGAIYNSAVVLSPQGLVGCYRKIHLPGKESCWAAKGETPLLFDTPWGKVGLGICYDTYLFPELLRHYGALGARLYLNPTAAPAFAAFDTLYYNQLKARVAENGFFIASANLVGQDRKSRFPGGSLVIGPGTDVLETVYYGKPLEDMEGIVMAAIDLSLADRARDLMPIFTVNPLTGAPDWRPGIYSRLYKAHT